MGTGKRMKCTRCEYAEVYDSLLELKGMMCPECGYTNTMIIITPMRNSPTAPRESAPYKYFASNSSKDEHNIDNSFYGEVESTSEIQAYHTLKKKYKSVLIIGRGKKNENK